MKLQELLQELKQSTHYLCFQEENKDAYFSAAFLILDLENKTEQIQLDFFLPKENKIAAFSHPFSEPKIHDNIISVKEGKTEPGEIKPMAKQITEIKIDIDQLEETVNKTIKENESRIQPTKIIAILKDDIWNLTAMDNTLGIVRIKINPITEELIEFSKGSLMDFMGMKKK